MNQLKDNDLNARIKELEQRVSDLKKDLYEKDISLKELSIKYEYLRDSEEKYRYLVENLNDLFFRINRSGEIEYASPQIESFFGFIVDEVIGRRFSDYIHPDDRSRISLHIDAILKGQRVADDYRVVRKNGDSLWVHTSSRPIFKEEKVIGVQGIMSDISYRKAAEEKLKGSEERFRILFDFSPIGIAISHAGIIRYANRAFCHIFGCAQDDEVVETTLFDFFDVEFRDTLRERNRLRESGVKVPISYDAIGLRKDGERFPFHVDVEAIELSEGLSTIIFLSDISERLKSEDRLRESEEKYRLIFEQSPAGIFYFDRNLVIQDCNNRFIEILKSSRDNLVGLDMHVLQDKGVLPVMESAISGIQGFYESDYLATSSDARIVVNLRTVPIRGSDGSVLGAAGIVEDITGKAMALRDFHSERERLSVTLRSIGDGVITTDIKGRVTLLNAVAENLTGWTQEEAIGIKINDIFRLVDEQTRSPIPSPVDKVMDSGLIHDLPQRTMLVARDGREFCIADSCAPIRDRESKIIGVVLVFRDITEKRYMEIELEKHERLESIGILAGGIAHDFNNILTAIVGNISLAKLYSPRGQEIYSVLEEAENAAMRAKDLTNQLLTFSRGGMPVKKLATLGGIIKEAAGFVLRGSRVRCIYEIDDDLWAAEVDTGQIGQVVQNLVINAEQAMPGGGFMRISAKNFENLDGSMGILPGRYIKIIVSDQGCGIPPEQQTKIFDPYYTTKEHGSGLGLSVAYSIVIKHGGYMSVDSTVGLGSVFTLMLPASSEFLEYGGSDEAVQPMASGRVLIMDDDEHIRNVSKRMLVAMGFEPVTSRDGLEAIAHFREASDNGRPFDAVILDLTIPGGMGGLECLKALMIIDPCVRAIVSSGYSNDPIISEYKNYGFKGFIAKPYRADDIRLMIEKVLKN
jgi:PAS domain S-box-containing protein